MSDSAKRTRRTFLTGWLRSGAGPGQSAPPSASEPVRSERRGEDHPPTKPVDPRMHRGRPIVLPIHRPPGAVNEAAFLAGCTRCNDCITACPVHAIVLAPARFRHAAGTPMIDPYSAACVMCSDTPCISVCQPGVLRADRPLKMGVAYVERAACLAYTGSFCTVCAERCPVPGAIELSQGKPTIRAERCTGCGVCAEVCPAPANAIVVMPLADRP
ncbi:MAG: 4Fe-4S dicluster domain-containing protein [Phycisphaerales bacterium]|nr:4Fe-4S dicluster domain-containing protein [Phycisphaerales bacterium]